MNSTSQDSLDAPMATVLTYYKTTVALIVGYYSQIPGSGILWRYILASHQNDPFRTFLEAALIFFIIRTWRQSRKRHKDRSGKDLVPLTAADIDELVEEWKPAPLIPPGKVMAEPPIIMDSVATRMTVIFPTKSIFAPKGEEEQDQLTSCERKQLLNLASANFGGMAGNKRIREKAIECARRYGVGSCGPAGFYGMFDVHMELERDLANFLGVQSTIIYPQNFTAVCSVIPSFAKRGDIIVADRGVNFAVQKGIEISRSNIRWYDHNDMSSLERVLDTIEKEQKRYKRPLTRKFIVTEGVFENDGTLCDLPKIMELKRKYKYRLILDESWSFGILGKTGRGITEFTGVPASEVEIIVGSLATAFSSAGGFCAGSLDVITHQRINSPAYVFSASMPPLLAVASSEAIRLLSISPYSEDNGGEGHPLVNLGENTRAMRRRLDKVKGIHIPSSPNSPIIVINITDNVVSGPEEQDSLLREIMDECANNGVLVNRVTRVWSQEAIPVRPSIRICVSSALKRNEVERGAETVASAVDTVMDRRKAAI